MTTWVVARDENPEGDRFWVCTNPVNLTEAWCAEPHELAELARRTRVQTVWLDLASNLIVEGAEVRSDENGPYSVKSDLINDQLDQLPSMNALLNEWKKNFVLRAKTLDMWQETESRPGLARTRDDRPFMSARRTG